MGRGVSSSAVDSESDDESDDEEEESSSEEEELVVRRRRRNLLLWEKEDTQVVVDVIAWKGAALLNGFTWKSRDWQRERRGEKTARGGTQRRFADEVDFTAVNARSANIKSRWKGERSPNKDL